MPENKPNKNRRVSEETVLSRARRLTRSELKRIAQGLGIELPKYDAETLGAALAELKKGKEQGTSEAQREAERVRQLEERVAELTVQAQVVKTENARLKREAQQAAQQAEKSQAESEIRDLATRAGVVDLDYGLHLLRRHIKALPAGTEIDAEGIKGYFEGLKKDPTKRAIFTEPAVPAGPAPVGEKTTQAQPASGAGQAQQPQSNLPPQGAPAPAPGQGARPAEPNALEMNKRDFNRHARETYGYSPGMA